MKTIRRLWGTVFKSDPTREAPVQDFIAAFNLIDAAEKKCNNLYTLALIKYPSNVLLLRSYAHFLSTVKREVKRARKVSSEADRLEEELAVQQASTLASRGGGDGTVSSDVDDKRDTVVVINKKGIIISVNKNCCTMFGHAGKTISYI